MQAILTRALCQMGIFMICTQTLIHFRPNDSYEKYLKLLVSVMLLVQILEPFSKLLSLGTGESLNTRMLAFQSSMEGRMEQALQHTGLLMEELDAEDWEAGDSYLTEMAERAWNRQMQEQETGGTGSEEKETDENGLVRTGSGERIAVEVSPIPSVSAVQISPE